MRRAVVLSLAAILLTACASSSNTEGLTWTTTGDPLGAGDGLAWADTQSGDVHLPDGSILTGDRPISSFVVAGRGAYVVDKNDTSLVEVTPDGARPTGAHVDDSAIASPDGRYLAFIDPVAGPKVEAEVHQLTSVVVDLETGKELLRSTRGMGDPDKDDLTVLYENVDYGVLAVTDKTAWIHTAKDQVLAVDLATGTVTSMPDGDISDDKNPWVNPQLTRPAAGGPANPSGTWGIYHVSTNDPAQSTDPAIRFPHDELERADRSRIVPRPDAENWYFEQWIDDTTVVGFADTGLDDPGRVERAKPSSLLTCTVPDGACALLPDTDDAILPEPNVY